LSASVIRLHAINEFGQFAYFDKLFVTFQLIRHLRVLEEQEKAALVNYSIKKEGSYFVVLQFG